MTDFFEKVHEHNLCTYYILPLLRLNKNRYGKSFINSYLTRDHTQIIVEASLPVPQYQMEQILACYGHIEISRQSYNDRIYFTYQIPEKWKHDVQMFVEGKYSRFCPDARHLITEQSGLNFYRISKGNGKPITDVRLLAILDDPKRRAILRRKLEALLDIDLPEDAELIDKPRDGTFIDNVQELIEKSPELSV